MFDKKALRKRSKTSAIFQHRCFGFDERYERIISIAEKEATNYKNPRIIDIGGSIGWVAHEIKKRVPDAVVYVNDPEPRHLRKSKKLYKEIKTNKSDICEGINLPKFDIVIMTEVIEHILYPKKALTEIFNLLNNNGTFIMTTPNISNLQTRIEFLLFGSSDFVFSGIDPPYGYLDHIRFYTKKSMTNLLETVGFKVIKRYGTGWFRLSPKHYRRDYEYENKDGELIYKWTWGLKFLYKIKYKFINRIMCLNGGMIFVCKKL